MANTGNAAGRRRRRAILDFIVSYQAEHGFSPTHAEIRKGAGPASPNDLVEHLRIMEEVDGVIRQAPKIPRSIVVTGRYEDDAA